MKTEPIPEVLQETQQAKPGAGKAMTFSACVAGALVPGLGHALLRKWDRALLFFGCITVMFILGLQLDGRIVSPEIVTPELGSLFPMLKFMAEAGSGLLYWISMLRGYGVGDPTAYTHDYANVFIYVAGLLNMLVIVDVFDIAMGRKQ